jgi:hypothetical protein
MVYEEVDPLGAVPDRLCRSVISQVVDSTSLTRSFRSFGLVGTASSTGMYKGYFFAAAGPDNCDAPLPSDDEAWVLTAIVQ